jgi:hypothetical protein
LIVLLTGVSERQQNLSSWLDYGWISYSTLFSPHQGGGERSYGPFFWPNDYVGVLLNMDEGYIAFVKDAEVRHWLWRRTGRSLQLVFRAVFVQ